MGNYFFWTVILRLPANRERFWKSLCKGVVSASPNMFLCAFSFVHPQRELFNLSGGRKGAVYLSSFPLRNIFLSEADTHGYFVMESSYPGDLHDLGSTYLVF